MTDLLTENARLRAALEWYGEQARLCRLIHREGDAGRNALAGDGGELARLALATPAPDAVQEGRPMTAPERIWAWWKYDNDHRYVNDWNDDPVEISPDMHDPAEYILHTRAALAASPLVQEIVAEAVQGAAELAALLDKSDSQMIRLMTAVHAALKWDIEKGYVMPTDIHGELIAALRTIAGDKQ